ncbi:MAG: Proton/glutamate-aspartate symporter [Chlamydiia bacterium]|nr:Proton/glutamate-aspartate symporter [Chlamydiia bacterium]
MLSRLKTLFTSNWFLLIAVGLGVWTGLSGIPALNTITHFISEIVVKTLKLISLPILFFSIVATFSGMGSLKETRVLGLRVFKYTLMTTIIAATTALGLYLAVGPDASLLAGTGGTAPAIAHSKGYLDSLVAIFPSNIAEVFVSNNVFGVVLIALGFGLSVLSLPKEKKEVLHGFFDGLFSALIKFVEFAIKFMPIAIWAFVSQMASHIGDSGKMGAETLLIYAGVVIGANLIQGLVVLPALLKMKRIPPIRSLKGMFQALSVAFFTKSSNAALPFAMRNAQENLGVSKKISGFSLPLCSTINMNGCAAFILITTLFVSSAYGVAFSPIDYFLWIFVATFAAIGNAGIPMGCYFLSSAILAGMGVPLEIMGLILPLYAVIDMIETTLNVWSDSCVTLIVEKESKEKAATPILDETA